MQNRKEVRGKRSKVVRQEGQKEEMEEERGRRNKDREEMKDTWRKTSKDTSYREREERCRTQGR